MDCFAVQSASAAGVTVHISLLLARKKTTLHYEPTESSNPLDGFFFSGTIPTSMDLPESPTPDPKVRSCHGIKNYNGPNPNKLVEAVAVQA